MARPEAVEPMQAGLEARGTGLLFLSPARAPLEAAETDHGSL